MTLDEKIREARARYEISVVHSQGWQRTELKDRLALEKLLEERQRESNSDQRA